MVIVKLIDKYKTLNVQSKPISNSGINLTGDLTNLNLSLNC